MTAGSLRLRSRDWLKLGQLANGGVWTVVSKEWVKTSTAPKVRVNAQTRYGYLWWIREIPARDKNLPIYAMLGNGGNIVAVLPTIQAVVVISTTNYKVPRAQEMTNRLLSEFILPSVESLQ